MCAALCVRVLATLRAYLPGEQLQSHTPCGTDPASQKVKATGISRRDGGGTNALGFLTAQAAQKLRTSSKRRVVAKPHGACPNAVQLHPSRATGANARGSGRGSDQGRASEKAVH